MSAIGQERRCHQMALMDNIGVVFMERASLADSLM